MPIAYLLSIAFLASLAVSLVAARLLTRVPAGRRELDAGRHFHVGYIPRIGGVAVFAGLIVGTVIPVLQTLRANGRMPSVPDLIAVLVAAGILFLAGLVDDIKGIPAIGKLTAQLAAAFIVYAGGFRIDSVEFLPGHVITLGWLALPITVVWLVGVSNAFNLIDGLDGLSGGVAIIGLAAVSAAAIILGNPSVTVYAIALTGGLLGFLRFNFPRARIFLGDSGALVVGFLLALLTVKGATRADGVVLALAPIFALSYPLLDTGVAILRRWLRGVPLARGDRRHIHHQLHALGFSPTKSVLIIYAWAFFIGALGVCATFAPPAITAVVATSGVVILLGLFIYGFRLLDYHEFHEAGSSIASVAREARLVIQDRINARDVVQVIAQAETRREIDAILEDSAGTFRFAHMQLCSSTSTSELPLQLGGEQTMQDYCKLVYPIIDDGAISAPLFLAIWCPTDSAKRTAGPEQVARILALPIADAVRRTKAAKSLSAQSSRVALMHAEDARENADKVVRGVSASA